MCVFFFFFSVVLFFGGGVVGVEECLLWFLALQ